MDASTFCLSYDSELTPRFSPKRDKSLPQTQTSPYFPQIQSPAISCYLIVSLKKPEDKGHVKIMHHSEKRDGKIKVCLDDTHVLAARLREKIIRLRDEHALVISWCWYFTTSFRFRLDLLVMIFQENNKKMVNWKL